VLSNNAPTTGGTFKRLGSLLSFTLKGPPFGNGMLGGHHFSGIIA